MMSLLVVSRCRSLLLSTYLFGVIEMTSLYDARYSVVLLRLKNEVKPLSQSAEKWICMGKWPVSSLAIFFRYVLVVRLTPDLFTLTRRLP